MMLSLVLLYVDLSYKALSHVRQWLTVAATPVFYLADLPARVLGVASEVVISHTDLLEENARLKARNLLLEQKVQKLASLTAQNIRLRELLNSSELVDEQVLVAEVVGIDPDPFKYRVIINKGSLDNVYEGQALLDAHGVMGQVIEVSPISSRVMMITDTSARVPVQNNRTKYRGIAAGLGKSGAMELLHIPDTADFKVGDLMTTSGLGGVYPEGFPLGKITEVIHNPGSSFATITLSPMAETNRSRLVLLVFRSAQEAAEGHLQGNSENVEEGAPETVSEGGSE